MLAIKIGQVSLNHAWKSSVHIHMKIQFIFTKDRNPIPNLGLLIIQFIFSTQNGVQVTTDIISSHCLY